LSPRKPKKPVDMEIAAREREKDFAVLDEIREAFKDVPQGELEREVDEAVASVRRETNLPEP